MMEHCKTCKHWKPCGKSDNKERRKGGHCMNEKKITEDYGRYGPDMLVYPYIEGGDFWTGPEFGCVHHEV